MDVADEEPNAPAQQDQQGNAMDPDEQDGDAADGGDDEDGDGEGDGDDEVEADADEDENVPVTPTQPKTDRFNPETPETPAEGSQTPYKYTPGKFALKPAESLPRAVISGSGIWGEHFRFELHHYPTGFVIGRKNPNVDLDMSEYTDVRTVSHRHCMFVYNRKLNKFQLGILFVESSPLCFPPM